MNNGEDCPRCLGWTFDDEPCGSMLCQGIAEGRRLERAAIVAWLRQAQAVPNEYEEGRRDAMWDASERIARGEHEKGEGK